MENEKWRTKDGGVTNGDAAGDVVLSSRVRFARNVEPYAFPGWASRSSRQEVRGKVRKALKRLGHEEGWRDWGKVVDEERMRMEERHWVSKEMVEAPDSAGVFVSGDGRVSVLVNEEDHLRIQGLVAGYDLRGAWGLAKAMERGLAGELEFAYSKTLGFLTACPSNVGCGMRGSVMVHLAGLALSGEVESCIRGIERMGYVVRGVSGEDSDSTGEVFQISNTGTLGTGERKVLEGLEELVNELVRQERWARQFLREDEDGVVAEDCVARALGVVGAARLMTSAEGLTYLSAVRLGVAMGMVEGVREGELEEAMVLIQPAHLARATGNSKVLAPEQEHVRDGCRAEMMRKMFSRYRLKEFDRTRSGS